jgi:hypothetical protein
MRRRDSEKPEEFYSLVRRASFPPYGEAFQKKTRLDFVTLYAASNEAKDRAQVIPLRPRMKGMLEAIVTHELVVDSAADLQYGKPVVWFR